MNILFCGSRNGYDIDKVYKIMLYYRSKLDRSKDIITHGGAIGIDIEVDRALRPLNFVISIHYPNYNKYGISAPIIRDDFMVDINDKVIALWNGYSRGTKHTIDYAKKHNKEVITYIVV